MIKHSFVDMIVHRKDLRSEITRRITAKFVARISSSARTLGESRGLKNRFDGGLWHYYTGLLNIMQNNAKQQLIPEKRWTRAKLSLKV